MSLKNPKTTEASSETTTLRPKRTTEPLPTAENPLLRFYPTLSEEEEEFWRNNTFEDKMQQGRL
jgi:hypothetical protein